MIVTPILFLIMAWMSHRSQRTQRNSCKAHDSRKALCFDMCVLTHSVCWTLCDPMDCSPADFSASGILQARILEWLPFPSPEALPDPEIEPMSLEFPVLAVRFFTTESPGKP